MSELRVIERQNKRVLLTAQLAEQYQTDVNNIQNNFFNHKDRFEEGKQYHILQGDELRQLKREVNNIDLVPVNVNKLYLWTESGALRHAKILDTDKAWETYEILEDTYFSIKEGQFDTSSLSPDLQMFNLLFKSVATQQLQVSQLGQAVTAQATQIQNIKDTIVQRPDNWRKEINEMLNKIAYVLGENEFRNIRTESYKLLSARAGVRLEQRLENLKKKLYSEGHSKTAVKVCKLDCIEDDKKLREIYTAIVKEYMIKYVA